MDTATSEPVATAPIEKLAAVITPAAVESITNGTNTVEIGTVENGITNGHHIEPISATSAVETVVTVVEPVEAPVAAVRATPIEPIVADVPIAAPIPISAEVPVAFEPIVAEVPIVAPIPISAEVPIAAPIPISAEVPVAFEPIVAEVPIAAPIPISAEIPVAFEPIVAEVPIAAPIPISAEVPVAFEPIVAEVPIAAPIPISAEVPIAAPIPISAEIPIAAPIPISAEVPIAGPADPSAGIKIPAYVAKHINDIAIKEGFSNFTIDIGNGANHGDGFVGDIAKARIVGNRTTNGITYADAELILIVKLPPENKVRRVEFGMKLFERETYMYNEVLPALMRFQHDHGLRPGGAGFHAFPKCYLAHYDAERDESVIIMEDIREKGYKMESKFKTVQFPLAKTVMEKLAELHGISLAMKQQRPAEFARFKVLADVMASDDPNQKKMMKMMINSSIQKAIATLDDHETVLKEKVLRVADLIPDETDRYLGENSEPFSVINHGDSWINNMMFKYESGQAKHIVFLDWQCSRYAAPVLDLVYFLFLCTDAPLRSRFFDDLIQAYHHSLRAQLERLGADVNELFPLTAMLRQLKNLGRFSLGIALFVVPMLCTENEDLADMNELAEKLKDGNFGENEEFFAVTKKNKSKYDERMSGILRDMNKRGFFN